MTTLKGSTQGLKGMDTEGGLAAADAIDQGSQQIAALARRLDNALHGFDWAGPDAEDSRSTWNHTGRPSLDTTSTHLAALAVQLRKEAQAQDVASGEAGTGAAGTAPAALTGPVTIGDRLRAFWAGLVRAGDHYTGYVSKLWDLVTGREDWSVSEVVASAIATDGALVGAVANGIAGRDLHWFGEGPGQVGTPVPAGGAHPAVPPRDLGSLMDNVTSAYDVGGEKGSTGDIRITTIRNGSAPPTYVVAVPGTETWTAAAGANPHDLSGNVAMMANEPTAGAETMRRAMDAAGIPPGSKVLFVTHSQAGIAAAQLLSDQSFTSRYQTSLLTYGSPIDHMQLQPGVNALQLQHVGDVVPRLDLGGISTGTRAFPNTPVPGVVLADPQAPAGSGLIGVVKANHDYHNYAASVRATMATNTADGQRLRDFQSTVSPFLVGTGGTSSAVDVPVRRGQ